MEIADFCVFLHYLLHLGILPDVYSQWHGGFGSVFDFTIK